MTIEEVLAYEEKQIFDRKSINIDPKALAISIVAFANADGGTIAIGISDKTRRVEGTDYKVQELNELLRVPYDFCEPSVNVKIEKVSCIDYEERENHIVLMHIEPSMEVHTNQADEAYLRIGDKSKKLTFEERMQLVYDKGERYFEDKPVWGAGIEDIDFNAVQSYIKKIGYNKTPFEYLRENKGFIKEKNGKLQVSSAAILLFGKNPQSYFPRARIRFIRYEGTEEKFGAEMNVIKDIIFQGTILKMIRDCIAYLNTQIKEKTYLGKEGLFVTEEEYPKFVRQEIIVNAVTHRAYSISGTDIQVKMFDNRIVVESPGKLPGLVRTDNIRHTHFSRNPKIAEFLKTYNFVKEYGEGVNRMCNELECVGLRVPEYCCSAFILHTIVYNTKVMDDNSQAIDSGNQLERSGKKLMAGERKLAIEQKNLAIKDRKLAIEDLKLAIEHKNYKRNTKENIILVYENIEVNQVFGTAEVARILHCSIANARLVVTKLRQMNVICEVKGLGKAKYRFINESEL